MKHYSTRTRDSVTYDRGAVDWRPSGPWQANLAVAVWLIVALLQSVGNSLHFLSIDPRAEAARQASSPEHVSTIAEWLIALLVVVGLLRVAPLAGLAVFVAKGHAWARIAITAVGSALFLLELISLSVGFRWGDDTSVASLLLIPVATYLMFTGPANNWFAHT